MAATGDQHGATAISAPILTWLTELLRRNNLKCRPMIAALNSRFKHVTLALGAAIASAAFFRHTAHVYAGFSREEIRSAALMMCLAVLVLLTAGHVLQRAYPRD